MSYDAHSLQRHIDSGYAYAHIHSETEVIARLQDLIIESTKRVALVTIDLRFEQEGRDTSKHALFEEKIVQSTCYILDALRVLVRRTDVVYVLGSTCYFLLLGANIEGASIVCNRLWDALLWRVHNISESDMLRPRSMSIGYSVYSPYAVSALNSQMYESAAESVQEAREAKQHFEVHSERKRSGIRSAKSVDDALSATHAHRGEQRSLSASEKQETEPDVSALARKLGIPYLSLIPRKKRAQIQQLIALELAQELRCYPLGRERGMLTVAVADPQDASVLERLRRETGLHIFPVLTQPQELQMALDQLL